MNYLHTLILHIIVLLLLFFTESTIAQQNTRKLTPDELYIQGEKLINGVDGKYDPEEGFKILEQVAKENHTLALYLLGDCYYSGTGIDKDDKKAFNCVQKAAEQGMTLAQERLGDVYLNGIGVDKNETQAFFWYQKAAEKGRTESQFIIGLSLLLGTGTEINEKAAFNWFQKAAEKNYQQANAMLGFCYCNGTGTEKDYQKAIKHLKIGAQGTDSFAAIAQHQLCCIYYGFTTDSIPVDYKVANTYLEQAVLNGNAEAQTLLGTILLYGDNNNEAISIDEEEGEYWLLTAFNEGNNSNAAYTLGSFYLNNGRHNEAYNIYIKLAESEQAQAEYMVGYCYYFGHGVEINKSTATEWFKKSAKQEYPDAQFFLGVCYMNGDGVEKDPNVAVMYYQKAADNGSYNAQQALAYCYKEGIGTNKNEENTQKWQETAQKNPNKTETQLFDLLFSGTTSDTKEIFFDMEIPSPESLEDSDLGRDIIELEETNSGTQEDLSTNPDILNAPNSESNSVELKEDPFGF